MEINTFCPECENGLFLREMPRPGRLACGRCGKGRDLQGQGALDAQGAVSKCAVCGCAEFYRQKDFNTRLGLWLVALMVVSALVFNRWFLEILVGFALLDLALYFGLGDIVICYDCRAIYRGLPISDRIGGFDLKIHDRYIYHKKKEPEGPAAPAGGPGRES